MSYDVICEDYRHSQDFEARTVSGVKTYDEAQRIADQYIEKYHNVGPTIMVFIYDRKINRSICVFDGADQ